MSWHNRFFWSSRRKYERRVEEFCAEHKSLHMYTRVARGQDGVEIKSMIDLVLVKKAMLHYVRAARGME